jgi:very-short-patch-repair endonuclease
MERPMQIHSRNLKLVKTAKNLRRKQIDAEKKLWYRLRDRRFENLKFRRQYPIGKYVADFICPDKMLVIELDGGQHAGNNSDIIRDNWLKAQGYITLRFWNNDIMENIEGVLQILYIAVSNPHPGLLPGREKELTLAPNSPSPFQEECPPNSPSPFQGEGRGEGLSRSEA